MFVKVTPRKKKDKTYYYAELVESYREDGKNKHRRILYFGSVSLEISERLKLAFSKDINSLVDINELIIESSVSYGSHYLVNEVIKQLKLVGNFTKKFKSNDPHISVKTAVKYIMIMIYSQITAQVSKYSLVEDIDNTAIKPLLNIRKDIDLQTLYRSLEVLEDNFPVVEQCLYELAVNQFSQDKKELFYDITSSYFEGHKCIIAEYGYSRDKRGDKTQIVIGLVTTKDGFPIKCNIYNGNTVDKTTVTEVITQLKDEYNIEEIIFVGDRGMLTAANVEAIEDLKQKYVMAIPRQWTKKYLSDIKIDPSEMEEMDKDGLYAAFIETPESKARLLLCLNTNKRADDESYRNNLIRKITDELNALNEGLNSKRSRIKTKDELMRKAAVIAKKNPSGKYLQFEILGDSQNELGYKVSYKINETKLAEDQRLDGTFVIQSNVETYTNEELLKTYKNLSKVENAFKIIKNDLDIRPIYHYKEDRIKGHVYMCILSYFITNAIDYTLKKNDIKLSARKALRELSNIHLVKVGVPCNNSQYKISAVSEEQKEIIKAFDIKKIKPPKLDVV